MRVYAPTKDMNKEEKDEFYDQLEAMLDYIPCHDMKNIAGVVNTLVGKQDIYIPITGEHSLHEVSNNNNNSQQHQLSCIQKS